MTEQFITKGAHQTKLRVAFAECHRMTAQAVGHYLTSQQAAEVLILNDHRQLMSEPMQDVDIVLLDCDKVPLADIQRCKSSVEASGGAKVAVFCREADQHFTRAALSHGADGVIDAKFSLEALPNALELIASGEVFVPASVWNMTKAAGLSDQKVDRSLTDVEANVLRFISEGAGNKEIARNLSVSEVQTKMIVRNICKKLGARNRAHAVAIGIKLGLF